MNWSLFLSIFSLIFVAELPGKTALATLMMSTRGRPVAIFSGVALAFVVQSLIGVFFGTLFAFLPHTWVHLGAGLLFLGFALHTWFARESVEEQSENPADEDKSGFFRSLWKAFLIIFIAEWGDLTQIATASFAAHYPAEKFTVFCAATLALWAVAGIVILIGQRVKSLIKGDLLRKIGTTLFAAIGIYFIYSWYSGAA